MLSRVAEHIYWMARYLERAENTARMVSVNAMLLMDLPPGYGPGWNSLIAITGSEQEFYGRYATNDEDSVVRFLLADPGNPGSILRALIAARSNARTIRDILPREGWEQLNALYHFASDHIDRGHSKPGRDAYLKRIVLGAQTLAGLLDGTMSHDIGYQFLRIGRYLERADMTTRIIDVRSADPLPRRPAATAALENVQWMSVLKSLSAYHMYRRAMQVRVQRGDVLRFLFQDSEFPRAFYHCLGAIADALATLDRSEGAAAVVANLQRTTRGTEIAVLSEAELHQFIDDLQIGIGELHGEILQTWFSPAPQVAQQ